MISVVMHRTSALSIAGVLLASCTAQSSPGAAPIAVREVIEDASVEPSPEIPDFGPCGSAALAADRLALLVASHAEALRATMSDAERAAVATREEGSGQAHGTVAVSFSPRGCVAGLSGPDLRIPSVGGATPTEQARSFVREHGAVFGIADPDTSITGDEIRSTAEERTVVRFSQQHRGLPTFGSQMVLHVRAGGEVSWVLARVTPDSLFPTDGATLTAEDAATTVGGDASTAVLGYFDPVVVGQPPGDVVLAWRFRTETDTAYVDARTAAELARRPYAEGDAHREVFRCSGCTMVSQLPGDMRHDDVCHVTGLCADAVNACTAPASCTGTSCGSYPTSFCETSNPEVGPKRARDNAQLVYDYLSTRHGRDGWDDNQFPPLHRMRISADADRTIQRPDGDPGAYACNSEWRSLSEPSVPAQVVLGSSRYCLDVLGHEVFHGVDESELDLTSLSTCAPTGALEHGIGDVFGEFIERFATGSADWEHGTGCPTCGGARNSLLSSPPSRQAWCSSGLLSYNPCNGTSTSPLPRYQPGTLDDFRPDCGGHWNSTIVSQVGWLMGREVSQGYTTVNGLPARGIGEAQASGVWYRALRDDLAGAATFADFRNAMLTECASTSDPSNCWLSVFAGGFWSSDISASLAPSGALGIDIASYPLPTPTTWYSFYWRADALRYRTRTCPVSSTACSWSSEIMFYAGTGMPAQTPAVTTLRNNGPLFICYRNHLNGIWCDRWNGVWSAGPDPQIPLGTPGPVDSLTIAHFNGALYMAYQKSNGLLYWRRLVDGTSTWTAEQAVGHSSLGGGPVLASSDEDVQVADGNELFLVFRVHGSSNDDDAIAAARFDPGTSSWGAENIIQTQVNEGMSTLTHYYRSQHRPSAAFYRGRLHVVSTDVGRNVTATGANTLWYGSCAPPCAVGPGGDWTQFVQQDGGSQPHAVIDNWGMRDGYLSIVHRAATGSNVYWRYKLSQ